MSPATYGLVGAVLTAVAAAFGAYLRSRGDAQRIADVEAPATAATAWSAVFEVTHRTMLSLQGDVARLEQRLDDQDLEHRRELEERDAVMQHRERALQDTADSLRRLRSYVTILTTLLADNGIAFPPPPADADTIAPERRSLTAPGTVTAVVKPHRTIEPL